MNQRRGWNIHTRTQLISVGPALLLTLLLTGFLTFTRLQDLRLEQGHIGQLIAIHAEHAGNLFAAHTRKLVHIYAEHLSDLRGVETKAAEISP